MDYTYQYSWIIPFISLPVLMLLAKVLFLFPMSTKKLCRIWSFTSVLFLSIVMIFFILFVYSSNN